MGEQGVLELAVVTTHAIPLTIGGSSLLAVALRVIVSGIDAKFCAHGSPCWNFEIEMQLYESEYAWGVSDSRVVVIWYVQRENGRLRTQPSN